MSDKRRWVTVIVAILAFSSGQHIARSELDEKLKTLENAKKDLADSLNTKAVEYQKLEKIIEVRDDQIDVLSRQLQQKEELYKRAVEQMNRKIKELQNDDSRIKPK